MGPVLSGPKVTPSKTENSPDLIHYFSERAQFNPRQIEQNISDFQGLDFQGCNLSGAQGDSLQNRKSPDFTHYFSKDIF